MDIVDVVMILFIGRFLMGIVEYSIHNKRNEKKGICTNKKLS